MKKIPYILSTVALAIAVAGCSETKDDNPVLNAQPSYGGYQEYLNIPEYSEQYISLTKETQNGTFDMTCSQPDYGFAAAATYSVEVSFTPFEKPAQGVTNPEGKDDENAEGLPTSVILSTTFNDCASINIPNSELAGAIMAMLGIESPDNVPTPYNPLYVRLISQIFSGSMLTPHTTIYSNYITIKGVSLAYVPAVEAGLPTGIFLRGDMNGWGTDNEFLTTTEAGVYVVEGVEIGKGMGFKVATEDWGTVNAGDNGNAIQINAPYEMAVGDNPGNMTCPTDFMGDAQLVVKGGKYILTLIPYEEQEEGVPSNIYLVGDLPLAYWDFIDAYRFKTAKYKDNWVLENVTVNAGNKFKIAAAGWGDPNCGMMMGKEFEVGVTYTLFNDGASGDIEMPENFQGKVNLRLKDGDYMVTFVPNAGE